MSHSFGRRRVFGLGGVALVVIAAIVGVMAMTATAASNTIGVKTSSVGSKMEPIAVNAKGVALYTLSGDSAKHQLCTTGNGCFSVWPPLTVKAGTKVTKAAGVKGTLGEFKRGAVEQVTLNGHPLYTFADDGGKAGKASGDGIKSFGGTWHVVIQGKASSASAPAPAPTSGGGSGW